MSAVLLLSSWCPEDEETVFLLHHVLHETKPKAVISLTFRKVKATAQLGHTHTNVFCIHEVHEDDGDSLTHRVAQLLLIADV